MLDLYKNIRKYRTELKLTQQELAEKAGYKDKSMIAKIEKGLVDLPQSKIKLFAEIFGVTQSDLMGYTSSDSEFTRRTISLFSGIGELSKDLLLQQDGYHPGIQIVQPNGKVKTFDASSLVYSIMESVAEMPDEQLELVNNMVGGKKKDNIVYIENPHNKKTTPKKEPFTSYREAIEFLKKQDMLAACDGKNLSEEAIIQMANAILLN